MNAYTPGTVLSIIENGAVARKRIVVEVSASGVKLAQYRPFAKRGALVNGGELGTQEVRESGRVELPREAKTIQPKAKATKSTPRKATPKATPTEQVFCQARTKTGAQCKAPSQWVVDGLCRTHRKASASKPAGEITQAKLDGAGWTDDRTAVIVREAHALLDAAAKLLASI